jgi:hypothetical protein
MEGGETWRGAGAFASAASPRRLKLEVEVKNRCYAAAGILQGLTLCQAAKDLRGPLRVRGLTQGQALRTA